MRPAPLSHQSAGRVLRTASSPLEVVTVKPCAAARPGRATNPMITIHRMTRNRRATRAFGVLVVGITHLIVPASARDLSFSLSSFPAHLGPPSPTRVLRRRPVGGPPTCILHFARKDRRAGRHGSWKPRF